MGNDASFWIEEAESTRATFEAEAAFMQRDVVTVTEQDGVLEVGGPAVGPVLDVVGVDEGAVTTTGEATATIAKEQGTAQRRRDRAAASSEIEDRPGCVHFGGDETAVAR